MSTYQFKTNINCGGCVASVTPHLNQEARISKWEVNTQNPNKILTVETELTPDQVRSIITKAGFMAEPLS